MAISRQEATKARLDADKEAADIKAELDKKNASDAVKLATDTAKQRADVESEITEQRIEELYDLIEQVEFVSEKSNPEKSLKDKAEKSGMPYGILKKVFDQVGPDLFSHP